MTKEHQLLFCFSLHFTLMHEHQSHRPQSPALFTEVFLTDPKADVTLVTVPIETLATGTVFVTEAPAICAPVMNVVV